MGYDNDTFVWFRVHEFQIFFYEKCFKHMGFIIMNLEHQTPNQIFVDLDTFQALELIK